MALTKITGSVIKDSVSLSGNVSVGGTLTYQDVTNVDALGIGTFRTGIKVLAGQVDVGNNIKLGNAGVITATSFVGNIGGNPTFSGDINLGDDKNIYLGASNDLRIYHAAGAASHINNTGLINIDGTTGVRLEYNNLNRVYCTSTGVTLGGDIEIADKIVHEGDTNTAIRFPSVDTVTIETGGSQRFRVDSSGTIHTTQENSVIGAIIKNTAHDSQLQILATYANKNSKLLFGDAADDDIGMIDYDHNTNEMYFTVNANERLRIQADGDVSFGDATTGRAQIKHVSGDQTDRNNGGDPQYAFVGNEGTGMRRPSSNQLAFDSTGAERFRLDSSGRFLKGLTGAGASRSSTSVRYPHFQLSSPWSSGLGSYKIECTDDYPIIFLDSNASYANGTGAGVVTWSVKDSSGDYCNTASILSKIDATPSNDSAPGRLEFHTTTSGSTPSVKMTISSQGYVTIPSQPSFNAYINGMASESSNTGMQVMPFNTTNTNIGGHFKTSGSDQYKFVAPVAGNYYFSLSQNHSSRVDTRIVKNGVDYHGGESETTSQNWWDHHHLSCVIPLAVGDKVHCTTNNQDGGSKRAWNSGYWESFAGFLIG